MKFVIVLLSFFIVPGFMAQELPEVSIAGVGIYPSPFNEDIFVKNENQIEKIEIYNERYHKVLSVTKSNVTDANRLKKGTYFLKMYYKDQVIIRKVVKKG